jgi:predicted DNA-binding transcriptional regulator AlpA
MEIDPGSLRIMGVAEIKDLIGVSRQRVYQMAKRPDFPEAYAEMAQGKVWRADEIEAWAAEHRDPSRRKPGPGLPGKAG